MDVSLDLFMNAVISGLLLGGFYAAVSIGVGISFGLLDVVNIAHPAFILLGSYSAYIANTVFGIDPILAAIIVLPGFYALGMAAGGAKQNALAGETFERAIALDPKKADAWVGKALWLRQVGRASEAKKCLERALEMEPSNAQARAILDSMK